MKTLDTLHLSADERTTLEAWASASTRDSASNKRALRAAIVLAAAAGQRTQVIAKHLHVRPSTASKWQQRFVQKRLAGLEDKPRKGAPRRISDEHIADVVFRTLEPTPHSARPWSRRMMSDATGISRSTIHRIWNTFGIAPNQHAST